ncbi:peptidoglycan editing factor PgeF [Aneurinibacillus uraniidurans]|uniref:peptidoglycan editing factor PgeF n=1 Tax=Aneurinibacillus uraniidurans TaxID=2966586 RepID=UPI002349A127|nr:peptidoglycan editing factor PgeF [Aneurinibacillus sp. B1]WCN39006.1 peptidoglycan editing factor PgeF [Aneurinibacillus sp. B1]
MEPFGLQDEETALRLINWEARWPELVAGFSTRNGGTSSGYYTSLNCGLHVGDDGDAVRENRRLLAEANGFDFAAWTCAEQVHGGAVHIVEAETRGTGRLAHDEAIKDTDGLLTEHAGIFLASFYADCVPLFFYAPSHRVIGVAHAGWKGTVANIGAEMVRQMGERWQIAPEEIYAAIGPSIRSCCYEVNDVVANRVQDVLASRAEQVLKAKDDGKYMLNLQETNRILLLAAGILPEHIEVSHLCTSCRTDLFFSHRKEAGKTGRMTAFIALKEG